MATTKETEMDEQTRRYNATLEFAIRAAKARLSIAPNDKEAAARLAELMAVRAVRAVR